MTAPHLSPAGARVRLRARLSRVVAPLVATALVVAVSGPPEDEVELAADYTVKAPVKVATFNIHNDASYGAARAAVRRLVPKAHVIGLQEFYSPLRVPILAELALEGWRFWKPALIGADPVLYDGEMFAFVSGEAVQMTPGMRVEDPKSGGRLTYARPTYATVVRLWHRATGTPVTVVNAHLIARANKDGRPVRGMPNRVAAYKAGMAAVASTVAQERQSAAVFAVGDWNVHYTFDARERVKSFPFRKFKKTGFQSVWKTHRANRATVNKTGVIDGVWAERAPRRVRVLAGYPESDHRPVVTKYRLDLMAPS